jgi:hypothetical protein
VEPERWAHAKSATEGSSDGGSAVNAGLFRRTVKKLIGLKVAVRRAYASSLLSLLLLATLAGGGCISCEQYFMWPGVKSCCSPNGHCKTTTPPSQNSNRECKQIAFDHHISVHLHMELPVVAAVTIEAAVRGVEALERWQRANLIEPSPLDLQILNSTFLI